MTDSAGATSSSSTGAAAAAAAGQSFEFPREHRFPPMYTLQPNLNSRAVQLDKWSKMVQSYCAHARVFRLDAEAQEAIFSNKTINKRFSDQAIREVLGVMKAEGRAEPIKPEAAAAAAGDGVPLMFIYWRTPEEWAEEIEAWLARTGQQKGSVLTVYEVANGDGTRGSELHGIDEDVLRKALAVLAKRGKAQMIGEGQGFKTL